MQPCTHPHPSPCWRSSLFEASQAELQKPFREVGCRLYKHSDITISKSQLIFGLAPSRLQVSTVWRKYLQNCFESTTNPFKHIKAHWDVRNVWMCSCNSTLFTLEVKEDEYLKNKKFSELSWNWQKELHELCVFMLLCWIIEQMRGVSNNSLDPLIFCSRWFWFWSLIKVFSDVSLSTLVSTHAVSFSSFYQEASHPFLMLMIKMAWNGWTLTFR